MVELQPDLELNIAQAERVLGAWLGGGVTCSAIAPLTGGLVNSVFRLEFDRPPGSAVVKLHGSDHDDLAAEALALAHLAAETGCPVPTVYHHDSSGRLIPHAFLLVEHLRGVCLERAELGPAERDDIEIQLAEILVALHAHSGRRWGSLDGEGTATAWPDVVIARLAEVRAHPGLVGRLNREVASVVDAAIGRAGELLDDGGRPTLVHGDVWDGNVMVRREQGRWRVVGLLDPAVQYADPEMELAYLEVFDTPRDTLFATYTRHHRLRPGYERRRLVYWLHTALLHVALFDEPFFQEYTARIADEIRVCVAR